MGRIGIIKRVDKLGRIVIPKELRKLYKLETVAEVILTEEGILLRPPKRASAKRSK